jgi:hypothetical protein
VNGTRAETGSAVPRGTADSPKTSDAREGRSVSILTGGPIAAIFIARYRGVDRARCVISELIGNLMPGMRIKTVTRVKITGQYALLYRLSVFSAFGAIYSVLSVTLHISRWSDYGAAGVGIVVSGLEGRRLRRDDRAIFYTPRVGDSYEDVIDPNTSSYRVVTSPTDIGLHFTRLSESLNTTDIAASSSTYLPNPNLESAQYALGFLSEKSRNATVFNGHVVGLKTDLPEPGSENPRVELASCRYFDFLRTNAFAAQDVYHASRGRIYSGRDMFISHGKLASISSSRLANVIGVSTLAFCGDGKLLLVAQTSRSSGSPGLLAPSGSGALEQQDLGAGDCLQDILAHGVERELREETQVKPSELNVAKTEIIGYGRWLSRGAMPEFSAVTLLSSRSEDVCNRPIAASERSWVAGVMAVELEPLHAWSADDPARILPKHCRDSASFPLLLALASLADYLKRETDLAAKLRSRLQYDD